METALPPLKRLAEPLLQCPRRRPPDFIAQAAHIGEKDRRIVRGHRDFAQSDEVRPTCCVAEDNHDLPDRPRLARTHVDGATDVAVEECGKRVADVGHVQEVADLPTVRGGRRLAVEKRPRDR